MKWSIPERVVEEGRSYSNEGRVLEIFKDSEQQKWYSSVLGSERYQVILDGTAKEDDRCSCPYWQDHHYCKHVIAVELELRKLGYQRIMKNNYDLSQFREAPSLDYQLLAQAKNLLLSNSEKAELAYPIQIEYVLQDNLDTADYFERHILTVGLRIGWRGEKLYVVRHLDEFFTCLREQTVYTINQEEYLLEIESFTPQDQKVLAQLADAYNNQHYLRGSQQKGKFLTKGLLVTKKMLEELFPQKQPSLAIVLNINGKKAAYKGYHSGMLPYRFLLTKGKEGLQLAVFENYEQYFSEQGIFYHSGMLYDLPFNSYRSFMMLEESLKRKKVPVFHYGREKQSVFFSTLYPLLQQIGMWELDEYFDEHLVTEPLEIHFQLTLIKKKLVGTVFFHYGEKVVNALSEEDTDEIIVRDTVKEEHFLSQLDLYGYVKQTSAYTKKLPKGEELYAFFTSELPHLRKESVVELAEDIQGMYLEGLKYQPKIVIDMNSSWLDIRFDVSHIDEAEVDQIIKSLYAGEKYYTLDNGQIMSLESEEYQSLSENLHQLSGKLTMQEGRLRLPKYQSIRLEQQFSQLEGVTMSSAFQQLIKDVLHPENYQAAIPKNLQATLRPYQEIGYHWLMMMASYGFGGILADEMGLGKTIQAIAYMEKIKEQTTQTPNLVVAPASLLLNWKHELEKFAPNLRTKVISGEAGCRHEMLENYHDYDVLVTSYNSFRQDEAIYEKKRFHTLFLDEAQMVKNSGTKTFQALKKVKSKQRFALSGTPIENRLSDIWSLFYLLMPGFLPSFKKFQALSTEEINKWVQPFVLRREKQEVLKELPEKIETNLYSELTEEQKVIYLAQLQEMQQNLASMQAGDFQKNRMSILAGLTRLRQICCTPELFLPDYQGGSGKLEQLKELVQNAVTSGKRILLFSQFTSMLTIIEKTFHDLGIDTFYLRGSTPIAKRQEMVDQFNLGEKDVFLISLKAGGTGLNLTGADTVILYDLWWNPAVEDQATSRAHRIGQKNEVEVWRLIAEGTIEEKMSAMQEEKKQLFQNIIGGTGTGLSEEDIRDILML